MPTGGAAAQGAVGGATEARSGGAEAKGGAWPPGGGASPRDEENDGTRLRGKGERLIGSTLI